MSRPAVPAKLKRRLFGEAGYRCAVPTCRGTSSLQMEHIEPWAKVREHKFHNMIVLCSNCHGRVTRREIPKNTIQNYKQNLAILNDRYSLFEIRILEFFYKTLEAMGLDDGAKINSSISISKRIIDGDHIHLKGLIDDGCLCKPVKISIDENDSLTMVRVYSVKLTNLGIEFMVKMFGGEKIE